MKHNDQQLGAPQILYRDTQANIEALAGVAEGAIAYATDTDMLGTYDGAAWTWGGGGGGAAALDDLTDVDAPAPDDGQVLTWVEANNAWEAADPTGGSGSPLTVEEQDGTPSVANVDTIRVTNGTLTDDGGGTVTLAFGSAATDGSAIHDNEAGEIQAIAEKESPVAGDLLLIEDSEDSYAKKRVEMGNLPGGSGGGGTDVLMAQVFT